MLLAYVWCSSASFAYGVVHSLFLGVFLDSTTDFTVDARSVTPNGKGKVRAVITNPSGTKNDTNVTNNLDGTYGVTYTPYEKGRTTSISQSTIHAM